MGAASLYARASVRCTGRKVGSRIPPSVGTASGPGQGSIVGPGAAGRLVVASLCSCGSEAGGQSAVSVGAPISASASVPVSKPAGSKTSGSSGSGSTVSAATFVRRRRGVERRQLVGDARRHDLPAGGVEPLLGLQAAARVHRPAGDRPDHPGQLARHGGHRDRRPLVAHLAQVPVAPVEPVVRLPHLGPQRRRQALAPPLDRLADLRRQAVAPGRLDQHAARLGVAGLGDRTPSQPVAARLLARPQPEIRHHRRRRGEAPRIADLRHQDHRGHRVDPVQRLQRRHRRRQVPVLRRRQHRRGQQLDPLLVVADRLDRVLLDQFAAPDPRSAGRPATPSAAASNAPCPHSTGRAPAAARSAAGAPDLRALTAARRPRTRPRTASCRWSGTQTGTTSPARSDTASSRASDLSFFTRSPGARDSFDGAATRQRWPKPSSSRYTP